LSKVTYQTRLPDSVEDFCGALGSLFAQIERDLYKDLAKGEKLNDLKKSYQVKYQINARQFNSIHLILKGKIASRKECYQRQIKELEIKIKSLIKEIKQLEKKIKNLAPVCSLNSQKTEKNKLKFSLHHQQRKLKSCQDKLTNLKKRQPSLIFGGKKLWYAHPPFSSPP
jgi:chromosome segregation ATPase